VKGGRKRALVAVIVAALAGAGVLIALSNHPAMPAARHATAAPALLAGIPQHGFVLGSPTAPVTLVDYLDLQCPVCRSYDQAVMPTLIRDYVRTGKLRIELRIASILGPGSTLAGRALAAAARQDRAFDYATSFYARQGQEGSGYVVPDFLAGIGRAAGVDVERLMRDAGTPWATGTVIRHMKQFSALGFDGTPSFQIGRTDGAMSVLKPSALDPGAFTGPVDSLLG
jgi:protein-disulfide isomerase